MKRYLPLDEHSFRDISRRKTSLEQDQPFTDDAEGMQWLHSCSLDDEIDIGNHNVRIAGQRHADRQGSAIPMSRVAEKSRIQLELQQLLHSFPCSDPKCKESIPVLSIFQCPSILNRGLDMVLVVIRHGESEYNAAARQADNWADPKLYDPSLTARGCQQARQLRHRLAQELQNNQSILSGQASTVWVTSPLRRCIQTFLLSCPLLPDSPADNMGAMDPQSAVPQQVQEKLDLLQGCRLPPVRIVSCISERVLTYGDIGTQTSKLKKEFVPLKECFQLDAEHWWHGGTSNDKEIGSFREKETSSKIKERIAQAKRWLERQPESVIVLYGHSVFWKSFFSHEESMRNCEYRVLHW